MVCDYGSSHLWLQVSGLHFLKALNVSKSKQNVLGLYSILHKNGRVRIAMKVSDSGS